MSDIEIVGDKALVSCLDLITCLTLVDLEIKEIKKSIEKMENVEPTEMRKFIIADYENLLGVQKRLSDALRLKK